MKNLQTQDHWAIKSLSKANLIERKQVDHIRNEVFILASLDNPFIVRQMGFYQDQFYIYMCMEFVQGGEFFSYLQRVGVLSCQHAAFYLAQIVLAFDYLHSYKIAYRDLKPENLLISSQGYVKLADFGFAKVIEDRTYTICGTPDYIAPEVLLSKGHDWAVDWWSLGVLLYEITIGRTPFMASTPMEMYEKIIRLQY